MSQSGHDPGWGQPYSYTPLDEADALAIGRWRYPPPYAHYSMAAQGEAPPQPDPELLDPSNHYYAVRDATGDLIGFVNFGPSALVWDAPADAPVVGSDGGLAVGLGLRPDLTGHGLGLAFVQAALAFARSRFQPSAAWLYVRADNQRAITVYQRAGFQTVRRFTQRTMHGEADYLEMTRPAGPSSPTPA